MVQFLTLFLGLTSGIHHVELNVAGPVAAVEIRLDDRALATLTAAPWAFECDLGDRPLPHDLVAIARDADGRELDRAARWINIAPRRSQATLAIRTDKEGRAQALRLDWESIGQPEPDQIEVIFDGQPLTVTDPDDIPLPATGSDELHYASASVRFAGDQESRPETDFGSVRGAEISSELTAVVVHLDDRSSLPAADKMRSWFVKRGRPLEVHGVEKGAMDLFFIPGPGAQDALDSLAKAVVKSAYVPGRGPIQPWLDWQPGRTVAGPQGETREQRLIRRRQLAALFEVGPLDYKVSLRFLSPIAGPLTPDGLSREMFVHSRKYSGSEGGLSRLFQRQPPMSFPPQVGAAVAMAGMTLHAGNRRRAVVLISAGAAEDESQYSPSMTRDYLRALHVPLHVWSFAADPDRAWGESYDLGDPTEPKAARRLMLATRQLQRDLRNQRVVWLEGRHLPHQIELGPEALGIRFAGSGARLQ